MNRATFCDLFCAAYKCAPEDFSQTAFWRCLFPNGHMLARLIWRVNRACFGPDFELLQQVKDLKSSEEIRQEIGDFYYHHPARGFIRGVLRVRISGQRLLDLADRLFGRA